MIDKNYIRTTLDPKTNILHNVIDYDLTALLSNPYSENEFNNLILNCNLDDYSIRNNIISYTILIAYRNYIIMVIIE